MRCAVLGGGGFIGSHLSEALLAHGHEVRVFDRPNARFLQVLERSVAKLYKGEFSRPGDIINAISGCDVVYHLISTTVPQISNDNPISDVEANVLGTLHLLNAVKNVNVKKIVFSSSGGTVYGIPQEIPIKESHPTEPTSSYGISKLTIEKYLHLYFNLYGLDYCILRPANAYGIRQPTTGTQGVIGAFLHKAHHGSEITVWGDGSIVRDYICVSDIVSAFIKAGEYEGESKIFNIGSGQGHSLNDIIGIIEKVIQQPLRVKYLQGRAFDIPVNVLDISRAIKYLQWQPSVDLFEGISRVYEWTLRQE
ncbi:MAG: NAD-dependent epimerase/dehydratase family protein [Anaerolineales bacterium]